MSWWLLASRGPVLALAFMAGSSSVVHSQGPFGDDFGALLNAVLREYDEATAVVASGTYADVTAAWTAWSGCADVVVTEQIMGGELALERVGATARLQCKHHEAEFTGAVVTHPELLAMGNLEFWAQIGSGMIRLGLVPVVSKALEGQAAKLFP